MFPINENITQLLRLKYFFPPYPPPEIPPSSSPSQPRLQRNIVISLRRKELNRH